MVDQLEHVVVVLVNLTNEPEMMENLHPQGIPMGNPTLMGIHGP